MSGPEPIPPTQDQLLQEAATWFARMRGPDAEASRAEFEAWLKRGALHRQAYNRASEIFAMGKILAEDREAGPPAPRSAPARTGLPRFALLICATLVLIAAGWFALARPDLGYEHKAPIADGGQALPPGQVLATAKGGPRAFRLADGSLVRLDANSLLEVRLGEAERRLDLRQGRGRFEVFHEARPFIVHAGEGRVVARGTIFDVGYLADRRVTVRLLEGSVDVSFPADAAPRDAPAVTRRLSPGQSLSYGAQAPLASQSTASPRMAEAQPAGGAGAATRTAPQPVRDYDRIALAELVSAANRGSNVPIRLESPELGERRVSGRFRVEDTQLLAERLALLFDLVLDRRPNEIVLRTR